MPICKIKDYSLDYTATSFTDLSCGITALAYDIYPKAFYRFGFEFSQHHAALAYFFTYNFKSRKLKAELSFSSPQTRHIHKMNLLIRRP